MADEDVTEGEGTAAPAEPETDTPAAEAAPEAPADTAADTPAETGDDGGSEFVRADAEPTVLEGVKSPGQEEGDAEEDGAEDAADAKGAEAEDDEKSEAEAADADAEDGAEAAEADADADADADKKDAKAEDGDEKPEDAKAEEAEPEPLPPVEYEYELPETIQMDDSLKDEFHQVLDGFRADPSNVQPLIDLHNERMGAYAENLNREQHRIFSETRKGWRTQIMADDILGGAGHQTAMQTVARMRDMFVSEHAPGSKEYAADAEAFDGMLRVTGVGDHPVFMHFLHRMAQVFDEPSLPNSEINPPSDIGRAPGRRGQVLYDHPSSTKGREQ